MKKLMALLCAVVALSGLSGCAQVIQSTCNTDSAYATGVNDARQNNPMQANYAAFCQEGQHKINAAYRRGYREGLRSRSRSKHHHSR